jgi:hypothetical protein
MNEQVGTFEEWRVTGHPGQGFPPYEFIWSPLINPQLGDAHEAALAFVERIWVRGDWADGPHLSRRTVTLSAWERLEHP